MKMQAAEELVTPQMIRRRLIFDAMGDPVKTCQLVGMLSTGDDGDRAEQEASRRRLSHVLPLYPVLLGMSEWLAETATATQLENQEFLPEDFDVELLEMYRTIISSSVVSTISVLADLGIIKVNPQ